MLMHLTVCLALLAADDPTKADMEKLQGRWVFKQEDGTPKEMHLVVAKDRVRFIYICCNNGEKKGKIKIDATATPPLIDLILDEGKTWEGIYRLKGDTFEVYFAAESVKDRPTAFPREPARDRYMKFTRLKE